MKVLITYTILLFSLCTATLQAQIPSSNERPTLTADAPKWVQQMYADNPNVLKVDSLFEAYYAQTPKIRNNYIRFYERWHKAVAHHLTADGFINFNQIENDGARTTAEQLARDRQNGNALSRSGSPWTSMGPHQTYSPGGIKRVYQTNIYSFDIADSDPNTLYAGSENSGVWKTTNKGTTWTPIGDNLPNEATTAIEIHPTDANIVYACSNRYVHKTIDAGTNWTTLFNTNIGIDDIQIHPTMPNILVIGGDGGMRRTTDGGTTWGTVTSMTTWISDIEVNPSTPDEWYCLRKNTTTNLMEFWKSTDAGENWSVRNSGWVTGTTDEGGRMCVTAANSSRIYVYLLGASAPIILSSNDKGETWTVLTTSLGGMTTGQGYFDLSIAASETQADWVFAGTTGSYRSVDAGVTWTYVGNSFTGILLHTDLQEVKCVGGDIWTATDGGMMYSTDFFATAANAFPKNQGINGFSTWGFGQGWQEDMIAISGYHNGTKAMYSGFNAGDDLRIQGGEPSTGYVLPGKERVIAFSTEGVKQVPTTVAGSFTTLPNLGKYPNEDGYGSDVSPLVFSPTCYNTMFLGQANAFWKSTDVGKTFTQLYDFGAKTRQFEVSRSNPSVIYLATDANLYRSANGGTTWSTLTLPVGCSSYRLSISLSFTDENTLWITSESNANGNKIFKSTNGGTSWTNMSTTILNNIKFNQVLIQQGTNGGVYLIGALGGRIFYRNNTHTDWQSYSTNLPAHFENLRAIPFYQQDKIRIGGSRGIWQANLYESSAPIAQPTVDKLTADCVKDTFYFDDYSVLKYNSGTWNWNITPTPQYISSTSTRNPKVVFGALGTYSVSLTVTDANGTSTKAVPNMVSITTDVCAAQSTPSTMASFTGAANSTITSTKTAPDFGTSQDFTVSFWFKSASTSSDAAIITDKNWDSGSYNGWVFSLSSGKIWFNIGDGEGHRIDLKSATGFNNDAWHHAAASVSRTGNAVLYLDGINVASESTAALLSIGSGYPLAMGMDVLNDWVYAGQLDEVKIWKTALSQNQIRENMHLTTLASEPNLLNYYQFNDATSTEYDRGGGANNLTIGATASRTTSTAPVGGGTSYRMTVNSLGTKDFTGTNCQITFPATAPYPNGELVVSAINSAPDQNPTGGIPLSKYWIIRNFGTNSTFSTLTSLSFSNLGSFGTGAAASTYKLYKRASNASGTWGSNIDMGDALTTTNNNTLTFSTNNGITSFSQFTLTTDAVLPIELLDFKAVLNNKQVALTWQVTDEKDVHYYTIEHSTDGKAFKSIASESPKGNQTIRDSTHIVHRTSYIVHHETPQYGVNYYRLNIVEKDRNSHYSPIRSVVLDNTKPLDLSIYPNPTSTILNIQFTADKTQTIDFELFDLTGRQVYTYKLAAKEGANHLFFHTEQFAAGLYSLRITQGTVVSIEKVVIK